MASNATSELSDTPQLPAETSQTQQEISIYSKAAQYFESDGDFLLLRQKDFKGKTRAEQQRRFILLYTAAYFAHHKSFVPDEKYIRNSAEKENIIDVSHFTQYLNDMKKRYIIDSSDGFKLNKDGEAQVQKIIADIENEDITGCDYLKSNGNSNARTPKLSNATENKLKEWKIEDVDLGSININEIKSTKHWAVIGLWIITVHLRKTEKIYWNEVYHFLKEKYLNFRVQSDVFRTTMSKRGKSYFGKNDGKYYLTQQGQKLVEGWIAGNPIEDEED
jgi:hypothetical protein